MSVYIYTGAVPGAKVLEKGIMSALPLGHTAYLDQATIKRRQASCLLFSRESQGDG